jgi:hypothetical protein
MEPHNSFMSSDKDQIVLSRRQASMIMASMVIVSLFIFITGYFLGKRTVIHDFSSNVTQSALHDQIDYLLTTQSLQSSKDDETSSDDEQELQEAESREEVIQLPTKIEGQKYENSHNSPALQDIKKEEIVHADVKSGSQYACLIGFGTKPAANAFVARLKKHHVSVILKTVISKTASGTTRTWFQAITPTYDSAQELQAVVNKVKRLEHIRDNDIKIVHVK